jgi:hypothetical protein
MNNVDLAMNFANVVNLISFLLLTKAIIKDRNKLNGFSLSGSFLAVIAILGFEIGFYLMGNYFSFGLGLVGLSFWLIAFAFSFRNFIRKRNGRIE